MNKNYRTAYILAIVTIFYNLAEGLVSMWFGYTDETLALFGFGVDSLVEVISGLGVWHMIKRIPHVEPVDLDIELFCHHCLILATAAKIVNQLLQPPEWTTL
jgi:hypothetical protein